MEEALPVGLEIALAPEVLDEGAAEERAAFGLFTVRTDNASLTEGFDAYLNGFRAGPLVSGYHVAEWFAWNWWRLRWEGRSASADWAQAHEMNGIGEGYVWPNITIFSDGVRTAVISKPSERPDARPFRYVGSIPLVVPSSLFEAAVDAFMPRVIGRLREQDVAETNLDRLWRDILAERADPEIAKRRRLEALLGRDADAIDDDAVERLLADAARLGEAALGEIAANSAQRGQAEAPRSAADFETLAALGQPASVRDAVALRSGVRLPKGPDAPAWLVGRDAARALRAQEGLKESPVEDHRLAEMTGTNPHALDATVAGPSGISFALDNGAGASKIVLRSTWKTSRRFDLARILGDRLISPAGALHPATRAYTYRQKTQRSFAAEFLSPFEAVDDFLDGDFSQEGQQDAAEHFDVSPMTISTLLMNHGRIERQPYGDFDVAA